jgi:hypothetical protein
MKFTQPVSMKCSEEQYKRDLKKALLSMGYKEYCLTHNGHGDEIIATNISGSHNIVSDIYFEDKNRHGRYFIEEYNPQLFLALAGMTDSETGNVGEWWKRSSIPSEGKFTRYKIYKQLEPNYQEFCAFLNDRNTPDGHFGDNDKHFVKATKEEIITEFTKQNNKPMNIISVKKSDFKKLHDLACSNWKTKLNNFIARDFLYSDTIDFKSEFVNEMRSACTPEQLVVFKEIFGNVSPINVLEGFNGRPFFGELSKSPYIQPREDGEYTNQGFWLSKTFDWSIVKDEDGALVLLPKIKE